VKLLLEKGAEPESNDSDGQMPLSWATSSEEVLLKLPLETLTPLWRTAWWVHESVVKLLLEKGAGLESKDSYGLTPLPCSASGTWNPRTI
jgi:ankyrin repeat protein